MSMSVLKENGLGQVHISQYTCCKNIRLPTQTYDTNTNHDIHQEISV